MSQVKYEDVYFEPEIETAPRDAMRKIQEEKFLEQVRHAYDNSPFYRKKFDDAGVKPDDVRSLDDIGNCLSPPRTS